jgi:hypothetical protein
MDTEHGFDALAAVAIRNLGTLAAIAGEHDRAARLFGAADAFALATGVPAPRPGDDIAIDTEGPARRTLGDERFAAARRAGAALTAEAAVTEAMRVTIR